MLSTLLDFELPPHLIAQTPAQPRDSARLLRLNRATNAISHHIVRDLPQLLREGDLLVFNDTRVLRARLLGQKPSGGKVEALLLKERALNRWEAMLKPSARLQVGGEVWFGEGETRVRARLLQRLEATWEIEFFPPDSHAEGSGGDVRALLSQIGQVPLPPYIRAEADEERYQTTYSRSDVLRTSLGALDSAAAPTAGLHFTPELLEKLRERGVDFAFVTLAVGAGTFAPVKTATLEAHAMHREEFWIGPEAAQKINAQKKRGGRVVAVGTTSVRTLESAAQDDGTVFSGEAGTQLFLKPGSPFRVVDALLTNFHLPRSTLLALVAAFIEAGMETKMEENSRKKNGENGSTEESSHVGFERIRNAYAEAIRNEYRFFSFGDAMLLE